MTFPTDPWGDRLSDADRALLEPFVTSLDTPIFGLRNLPEVVKGALFSRYSRSDKSLRRILLDEFIREPDAQFAGLVGGTGGDSTDQLVATRQAEAFYERVLIGYGDDSVAELGGAHLACEGISNIAAKALEDSRIGLSPLEKSTRYVVFNRKVNDQYRYLREPAIAGSAHAAAYEQAMDNLFDTYSTLLDPTLAYVRAQTPCDEHTTERAYNSATRAKACDLLRGLLPMSALTNVGLFGNGRAFEYLLSKLYAAPHGELHTVAESMQTALEHLIPSFVKRASNPRGRALQNYLRDVRQQVAAQVAALPPPEASDSAAPVTLVDYDHDAEARVLAAILYPHMSVPLADARAVAECLPADQRATIIRAYVGERANRFHRPGRAFEEAYYTFDVLADIGAYRDLHRHRVLTQERQAYDVRHGFYTPQELHDADLARPYAEALERAAAVYRAIADDLPEAAQYAVPMAYRVRWRITMNLRELYHLAELRSAPQGHPTYRLIAQELYAQVRNVHPLLVEGMRFVDMNTYALERLDAERRLDAKLASRTPGS